MIDPAVDGQAAAGSTQEPLVFCKECGNNVHKQCFERWTSSKRASGDPITCVLCRAPWDVPADPGAVHLLLHNQDALYTTADPEDVRHLFGVRMMMV